MDRKGIIKFLRIHAYLNMYSIPFRSDVSMSTAAVISLASLAVLYLTD